MKNLVNKIIKYIKKNYIASTVVAAIILVALGSLIIIGLINMSKNKIELSSENAHLYQYVAEDKKEYDAKLSYENDKMVNIKSDTFKAYEGSPIYDQNSQRIIVPKTSSVIFYLRHNLAYRLPKYSSLTFKEGSSFISSNGKKASDTNFFIYDGEDMYIIPVKSVLKVNKLEIELSAYSYVIANEMNVTYYDYETDTIKIIDGTISQASLFIDEVGIDLLKDVTVINSNVELIVSNVDKLNIYLEEENGK